MKENKVLTENDFLSLKTNLVQIFETYQISFRPLDGNRVIFFLKNKTKKNEIVL